MITRLITSGVPVISLSDAKDHLRVTASDDDVIITGIVEAATNDAENYTWKRFTTQTYDLFLDAFKDFDLPFGELKSISSIKYYDLDDIEQTLAATVYDVNIYGAIGCVSLKSGESWPSLSGRVNPVTVRFACGYGDETAVPAAIVSAIKIKIELIYGNLFDKESEQLEKAYKSLLYPYRLNTF